MSLNQDIIFTEDYEKAGKNVQSVINKLQTVIANIELQSKKKPSIEIQENLKLTSAVDPFCKRFENEFLQHFAYQVTDPVVHEIGKRALDSTIITSTSVIQLLAKWLNLQRNDSLKLLYRGSKHGFDVKSFHALCDDKGPTLVVIRNEKGERFGGYTSEAWSSARENFRDSEGSFLFSVDKKITCPVKANVKKFAIWVDKSKGPTFGEGFDLSVADNSNKSQKSFCNYPFSTFECTEKENPLTSIRNFRIEEIEIFGIDIQRKTVSGMKKNSGWLQNTSTQ